MKRLSLDYLIKKLKKIKFEKFDLIVAVGKGGIIPASLIRNILDIDMEVMWLNFRDNNHNIIYKKPKLTKENNSLKKVKNKKILIVDDVSRTGKTLEQAKRLLKGNKTKTLVINGKADYSIINKKECVIFPWS